MTITFIQFVCVYVLVSASQTVMVFYQRVKFLMDYHQLVGNDYSNTYILRVFVLQH
jgi:hypothetical protein